MSNWTPPDIIVASLLGILAIIILVVGAFNFLENNLLSDGTESLFNNLAIKVLVIISLYIGLRLGENKNKDNQNKP